MIYYYYLLLLLFTIIIIYYYYYYLLLFIIIIYYYYLLLLLFIIIIIVIIIYDLSNRERSLPWFSRLQVEWRMSVLSTTVDLRSWSQIRREKVTQAQFPG